MFTGNSDTRHRLTRHFPLKPINRELVTNASCLALTLVTMIECSFDGGNYFTAAR